MKKLHTFTFYALITPALTLGAGSVLAQHDANMDSGRLLHTISAGQNFSQNADNNRQRAQRDSSRAQTGGYLNSVPSNGMHASNLIGTNVHTSDDENIGSIDDLILDESGQVVAIIVSVGGFLGMGQKDVAIGWDNLTRSGITDKQELRVDVTRADLKSAPKFVERDPARTARKAEQNTQRTAQKSGQQPDMHAQTNRRDASNHGNQEHRGHLASIPANGSHANNLIGMDVYTSGNEDIGSVDDLVISEYGQVMAIVVSVGGFLGVGQKDVAIDWDHITRSGTAEKQQLRANVTREALSSAPEFAGRN